MSAEHDKVQALFEQALKLKPGERAAFLAGAGDNETALRRRVEELLQSHDDAGGFLPDAPRQSASAVALVTEKPGDRIGRYKLCERLGEGGCGVVYVAEQEEPVRRRVALKVIKLGMDTKSVIARFEAERQALAMMDHPNIARVLDAGATDTGRPYFVMELVRGIKITDYCDQNNLSTRERLDLFIKVCQAVQHAHQKGIIHRDLKPSNILVTLHDGVPVPKVIDFGIAKATEGRLSDLTVYTELHQFIGTPAYMSPEQAEMSGLDIDTRSDIYSLGVLLYELLTGKTPFDAKELCDAGVEAMRRTIREVEPVKPSTRLTQELARLSATQRAGSGVGGKWESEKVGAEVGPQDSSHRPTFPPSHFPPGPRRDCSELRHLIPLLRGDLDWVVMKALEKDRTRRYETATGFAADIQRHLSNEPVSARPPSASYRIRKLVRRHQTVFAAGITISAALLIGLGCSSWMFLREKEARQRAVAAEREQQRLRAYAETNEKAAQSEAAMNAQIAAFLENVLNSAGPGAALALPEILDRAAARVGASLKNQPKVQSRLYRVIGEIFYKYRANEKALALHREALRLRRSLHQQDHRHLVDSLSRVAELTGILGNTAEADALAGEALAMSRRLYPAAHEGLAQAISTLATIRMFESNWIEGESLFREAIAVRKSLSSKPGTLLAGDLNKLAKCVRESGRLDEAVVLHRESVGILTNLFSENYHSVMVHLTEQAETLIRRGDFDEAEACHRRAYAVALSVFPERSVRLARSRRTLESFYRTSGRENEFAEVERAIRQSAQRARPSAASDDASSDFSEDEPLR